MYVKTNSRNRPLAKLQPHRWFLWMALRSEYLNRCVERPNQIFCSFDQITSKKSSRRKFLMPIKYSGSDWFIRTEHHKQSVIIKKIQLYSFLFFLFTPMPVLTGFVWTKKKKKLYALTFVDLSMDSNISNANDSRSVNIEFTKTLLVHWESREYSTVRLGHWRCCRHTWANEQQCQ